VTIVPKPKQLKPAHEASPYDKHGSLGTCVCMPKPLIYYQKIDGSQRQWTGIESSSTVKAPLYNCECKSDHGSPIDYYSCQYHTVSRTPVSCSATSPEVPPVLNLHKHPAAVTFPNGICCVISPRPDRSGISKQIEPSSSENNSASNLPINVQKPQANFAHAMVKKSFEGMKLGRGLFG